jgi:hypothetical protein
MWRAADLAAKRRGSSIRILLFSNQGSFRSARGTRVVLPAPGGAMSTTLERERSLSVKSGSTDSIGSPVMKDLSICQLKVLQATTSYFNPAIIVIQKTIDCYSFIWYCVNIKKK